MVNDTPYHDWGATVTVRVSFLVCSAHEDDHYTFYHSSDERILDARRTYLISVFNRLTHVYESPVAAFTNVTNFKPSMDK